MNELFLSGWVLIKPTPLHEDCKNQFTPALMPIPSSCLCEVRPAWEDRFKNDAQQPVEKVTKISDHGFPAVTS